jgi:asparagine synthase (glutamine-hydrolysing)
MCGVAGILGSGKPDESVLRRMSAAVRHRGPDDSGVWYDDEAGIGLAHARLSIVDLSAAGHQPMQSPTGRFVISYNGEIYNHLAIRRQLEETSVAPIWRGHSDTETLLAAFDTWGIAKTLRQVVGMFAFAVWDRHSRKLTLGRDRLGEKPLYYGWQGDTFLFGSELKALSAHPKFAGEIDRNAISLLLRHSYIPTPYSIYRDIRKLPPATFLEVSREYRSGAPVMYWDVAGVMTAAGSNSFSGGDTEIVDGLHSVLESAVKLQMMGDVPVGAFLSGGVDSSTIVALMQASSSRSVHTFTIGFQDPEYDEARYAREIANHLGTVHTELYVSPQQALDVVPNLPNLYCEPFADSSQIPTYLLSQLARRAVTVSLSGDGGDELFGGYDRYQLSERVWQRIAWLPQPVRASLGHLLGRVPTRILRAALAPFSALMPDEFQGRNVADRVRKAAGFLSSKDSLDWYRSVVSLWHHPDAVVIGGNEPSTALTDPKLWDDAQGMLQRMMAVDTVSYLPDDILVKVDRAAMGVSLETRVPLLDHRVVEFAWQVPVSAKVRGGVGKWPLRQVLDRYVPRRLIDRPKMGFGIPIGSWLRGPLREWAEDLLSEDRLRRGGFFHAYLIRKKWQEHIDGDGQWHNQLWPVLMFQAWLVNRS